MSKKKTIKKLRNRKLKPFTALMIKNRAFDNPWTHELFSNEDSAYQYWRGWCETNKFEFNWDDFELVAVKIIPLKKDE